jgi:F-type H+-transporting ATPase subunit epsilon
MAESFQLELVTPDRLLVSESVAEVSIPSVSGYLGVLPGHAPLLTELGVGEVSYRNAAGVQHLAVAWGFAEVLPDKVTILAETAERPTEIDVARAQQAKEKAQAAIKSGGPDLDYHTVSSDLKKAETRLEVAQKK